MFASKTTNILASSFVIFAILFSGCGENSVSPLSKLETGNSSQLLNQVVSSRGGTILINNVNSEVNGLQISIPDSAYTDSRNYQISTSKITKHGYGNDIKILTPLITISNGGGYSEKPMTVRIPVKIPTGQFALAFQYDEATQKIEALPLIYEDSSEMRFITRHFSYSKIADTRGVKSIGTIQVETQKSSIFISSIDAATLDGTFDTGFELGIDNFQFVNWGSYIADSGHCGGQSIAMMWYYATKTKNGSPNLYGIFDNNGIDRTPEIWQDDVNAFRFCSVLQLKMHWTNLEIYDKIDKNFDRDLVTYRSIAFAIRETGNPQCLYVSDGTIAHAIIAYKTSNGHISVCDPNFPTTDKRDIVFVRKIGDFEPYYSGENASNIGTAYFNIYQAANSALIDYTLVETLYNQLLNGTIGNDFYPEVRLKVRDANNDYIELKNGIKIPTQVTLDASATSFQPYFRVWDYANRLLISNNERDFTLTKGNHKIGIYYSRISYPSPNSGFIGFKWFDIEAVEDNTPIEPEYGPIKINLKIDGVSKAMPTAYTEYSLYRVIRANDGLGSGALGNELYVSPGSVQWGVGSFILPASSNNVWKEGLSTYFASKPGVMTISSWSKAKYDGTFSFEATNSNLGKTVKVEGDFHYPP
ncbi:MAG: hypothetical protein JST20_11830 [Bacteroidetes bacterium]|nr:hypothetical protein [Bacteroidota bacterium]